MNSDEMIRGAEHFGDMARGFVEQGLSLMARDAAKVAASYGNKYLNLGWNPRVIPYSPQMDIRNTNMLARGLGLRYLAVIESHRGTYIAKKWYRDFPMHEEMVIEF